MSGIHFWPCLALLCGGMGAALAASPEPLTVTLAFLGPTDSSAWRGAQQGNIEANKQGRFLGQAYELVAVESVAAAAALKPAAVVAAGDSAALQALVNALPGTPVFDVTLTDDASRSLCLPQLFHLQPTAGMKSRALAAWQAGGNSGEARAVAWNPKFRKYAALQLNKRYTASQGLPMDDAAWAGWAAIKLYSDAVARTAGVASEPMLKYLREDLAFDGQKGSDMSFRSSGQLRQVLLIEQGDKVVAEVPADGVDLDSLGGGDCPPAQ